MRQSARRIPTARVIPAGLLAALVLASGGLTLPARAAEAGDEPPDAAISTVNGKRFRMAKARLADRITRIADASGDQVTLDGAPAPGAGPDTDLAAVYVARIRVPAKLLKKMGKFYPRGGRGAFYGADAAWGKRDRAVFIAAELGARRPEGALSQQVEVAFDGPQAVPVQAGLATDPRAGVQLFSLSGRFADGTFASGTTDLTGWQPGNPVELYNAPSRVMGYHDAREGTYYLIAPIPDGATSVAVAVRSESEAGEIVDRLELPAGGRFIDIDDPAGGYDPGSGAPPLACMSVETRALPETADAPGGNLVRITVGTADAAAFRSQLVDPLEGTEQLDLAVREVGSADDALSVPAEVRLAPAVAAAILTLELPDGRWTIGPLDEEGPTTPGGEALVDLGTLTGSAGLLTGGAPDGIAAGDASCGRWSLPEDACAYAPESPLAALVGLDAAGVARSSLTRPDGALWCVGEVAETGGPKYAVKVGTAYETAADLERIAATHRCPSSPVQLGVEGLVFDCGDENFESYVFRVVPDAAADDPDAGLLISVDVVVDPARPFGERYDQALAIEAFVALGRDVAAAALPSTAARGPAMGGQAPGGDADVEGEEGDASADPSRSPEA